MRRQRGHEIGGGIGEQSVFAKPILCKVVSREEDLGGTRAVPSRRDNDGADMVLLDGLVEAQESLDDGDQKGQRLSTTGHGLHYNIFIPVE